MRSAVRFSLALVALLAASIAAYGLWHGVYDRAVIAAADHILHRGSPPFALVAPPDGGWIAQLVLAPDRSEPMYGIDAAKLHLMHVNVAVLPALLLAGPWGTWRRRTTLAAAGTVALFLVHVAITVGLVKSRVALDLDPEDFGAQWAASALVAAGELSGAMIWVAIVAPGIARAARASGSRRR